MAIWNMIARLTMDSTAFDRNSSRARRSMRDLSDESLRTQKAILGFAKAGLAIVGLGGGIYAAKRAFGSFVSSAMEAEESENLFTVSLGENAAAARQWSQRLGESLGLNEYAIRKQVATFNTMFESMGLGNDAALKMSEGLTQLSQDMASFYNLKPEEAFQKLQAGMTGETEPLKRLGILVNETTVKEYALRQGWIKQGETLSEVGKVYARYGSILSQTEKAQGDLARTQDSATNVQRSLRAEWEQTKIVLGDALLPAVTKVAKSMRDWLSENRGEVKRWANDTVEGFKMVVEGARITAKAIKDLTQQQKAPTIDSMSGRFGADPTGLNVLDAGGWMDQTPADLGPRRTPASDLAELKMKANQMGEAPASPYVPIAPGESAAGGEKMTREATRVTTDVSAAYRRMYNDMNEKSELSWQIRKELLAEEFMEYNRTVENHAAVWEWFQERQRDVLIQEAKATGSFFDGWNAGISEMQRGMETIGELGADMAREFRDGMVDSLQDAIWEAKNLGDSLKEVLRDMAKMATRWMLQGAVNSGMSGVANLFGVNVAHGGGTVGSSHFATRAIDASVFAGAPRAHSGLAPDEYPFILQRGEQVTSRSGVASENRMMGELVALMRQLVAKPVAGGYTGRNPQEVFDVLRSRQGQRLLAELSARNG